MNQERGERLTYLWIAEAVLRKHRRPLSARQLVTLGLEDGLFDDLDVSRTPQKSMQARLSLDILKKGISSRFLRTERGRFYLRELHQIRLNFGEIESDEYIAVRRAPSNPNENVLVIHKDHYKDILNFQGINTDFKSILPSLLAPSKTSYMPRTQAEVNSDYKQFITYTLIQRRDELLSFRRGRYNRAAAFLRGARCVGFGGHVTEDDIDIFSYSDRGVKTNAAREIKEELSLPSGSPEINTDEIEIVGVLNDDSSDVGQRHVAIVLRYWVPDSPDWLMPRRGEASITQIKWIKTTESSKRLLEFEYWSQLVFRKIYPSSTEPRSAYNIFRKSAFRNKHILCVCGSVGSGKSVTTERLRLRCGYTPINTGLVMSSLLQVPPVPKTERHAFQALAYEFISKPLGPETLAENIISIASSIETDRIIVDGIRQSRTLDHLRKISNIPVAVLFVHTPPDVAYRFYTAREAPHPFISISAFMEIYNAPVEADVRFIIQEADAVIYNWFGIEEHELVVEKLVAELSLASGTE